MDGGESLYSPRAPACCSPASSTGPRQMLQLLLVGAPGRRLPLGATLFPLPSNRSPFLRLPAPTFGATPGILLRSLDGLAVRSCVAAPPTPVCSMASLQDAGDEAGAPGR